MLTQILNSKTLKQIDQVKDQFSSAEPFGHVVIDDFFKPEFCQNLLQEFPSFKDKDAVDENKTVGKKAVVQTVPQIGPSYKSLDKMAKSNEFLELVATITGIPNLIYDPHYIGGGTHNNLDGQELDPHVDFTHHPITSHHRRLNLIVYLNHEWSSSWGGNIEFHKNPRLAPQEDDIISVEPLFNRAVIFETHNHSWHGFTPIRLPDDKKHISRKSFALYYYTNKRQQAVDPHSTIYVERPLSKRYKDGVKLTESDIQELHAILERRDQHLARLYENVTAQTIQISKLKTEVLLAKTLGNRNDQVKLIERQMELLTYDEARLMKAILELQNSTSWKITAPIRRLKRWLSSKS